MSKHMRIERIQEKPKKAYQQTKNSRHYSRSTKRVINPGKTSQGFSTQQWLPTSAIVTVETSAGTTMALIKTKYDRYVSVFEISAQNFNLKNTEDRNKIINYYEKMIKIAPVTMQVKILTEKTDISTLIERTENHLQNEASPKVLAAKEDYINFIREMSSLESSTKRFYLIIEYAGNQYTGKMDSDVVKIAREMEQIRNTLAANLRKMGNDIIIHPDEKWFLEDFLYRYLNKRSTIALGETVNTRRYRLDLDTFQLQAFSGKLPINREPSLNSIISPRGIDFTHPNYALVDGVYYTFLFVSPDSYPEYVYATWNNCFNFGQGVDIDMFFSRQDRDAIINDVMRRSARMKSGLGDKKDIERENTLDTLKSAAYIKERIRTGSNFYYGMIMLTIWDYDLQSLKDRKGEIILALKANEIRLTDSLCSCEQAFRMALPLGRPDPSLFERYKHNFLDDSVACCYPYDEFKLYDPDGWVIGLTGNGASLGTFNNFNTQNGHANANIGIFGTSGSGKTYLQLALSRRLRLHGVGVMFILPVKGYEYRLGVEALDGMFVDLSPGSSSCINIMEIRTEADLDAAILADMEIIARSKLQQKITQIVTFIQLLLKDEKFTSIQISHLEVALADLYAEYGITNENRSLYNSDGSVKEMPILNDLYQLCQKNEALHSVVDVLTPFINGACKNMNGHTNVDLNNKMVALDVSNTGDRYLPAFTFIALDFAYDKIKENLLDMWALFIDEGWKMMINEETELFVNELIKIVRGYAGSAILGTQNIGDVAKGKWGASMIDNCDTKFILKIGPQEGEIFQRLFNLSREEVKELKDKPKGQPLMISSNGDKIPIIIKVSQKEHDLFSTDIYDRRRQKQESSENSINSGNV